MPNPAIINDVQPQTPSIVINIFFLYLNTFLAVTLLVNFNLFQINGMCSKKILLPGFGALGNIKFAGFSCNSFIHVYIVAPTVESIAKSKPTIPISILIIQSAFGKLYIIPYIIVIILGINLNPINIPKKPPIIVAEVAYIIYFIEI